MKVSTIRRVTLTLVVIVVLISFFANTGSGNLSSLGWEAIAYICPLGAIETFLASWTFVPRSVIALVVAVVAVILLGKVFCAWLCPVPPLRRFFTLKKDNTVEEALAESKKALEESRTAKLEGTKAPSGKTAPEPLSAAESIDISVPQECDPEEKDLKACPSGCTSCAEKRKKLDSRHVVLGGALLSTAIFGFPVFCIVCPVGLTFASLIALWRLVGFNEPSWALLIYPLFLAVELFVLRKWCIKFCPLGALMSLLSIPNKLFKPRVNETKCLRSQGIDCKVCVSVCEEELDPHYAEGMHECTKCGLCKEHCPAQAITIPLYTGKAKEPEEVKVLTE